MIACTNVDVLASPPMSLVATCMDSSKPSQQDIVQYSAFCSPLLYILCHKWQSQFALHGHVSYRIK